MMKSAAIAGWLSSGETAAVNFFKYKNDDSSIGNEDSSMILQWKMKILLLKNNDEK